MNELTKLFWGSVTIAAGFGLATLFGAPDSGISAHHPLTAGGATRSTVIDQHPMGPLHLRNNGREQRTLMAGAPSPDPDFNPAGMQTPRQLHQQEPLWLAPSANQPTIRVGNITPCQDVELTAVQMPGHKSNPTATTAEFYAAQNTSRPVSFQPTKSQVTGEFAVTDPVAPTPPPLEPGLFPRPLAAVTGVAQPTAAPPEETAATRPHPPSRTGRGSQTPPSLETMNDHFKPRSFESRSKVGPVYASTNPSMRFLEDSEPIFSNGNVSAANFFSAQPAVPEITVNEDRPATRTHIVVDGDSLKKLASRYLDDPHRDWEIFKLNHDALRDPELLPIGAVLNIPDLQQATLPRISPERTTAHHTSLVVIRNNQELIPVRAVVAPRSRPQAQLLSPVPIDKGGNNRGN